MIIQNVFLMNDNNFELLEVISKFLSVYSKPDIPNIYQKKVLDEIISDITSSYNAIVEIDVVSICKKQIFF